MHLSLSTVCLNLRDFMPQQTPSGYAWASGTEIPVLARLPSVFDKDRSGGAGATRSLNQCHFKARYTLSAVHADARTSSIKHRCYNSSLGAHSAT